MQQNFFSGYDIENLAAFAALPAFLALVPALFPKPKRATRKRTARKKASNSSPKYVVTKSGKRFRQGSPAHKTYLKRLRALKKARAKRK